MAKFRYSEWDGSQDLELLGAQELFDKIADYMMAYGIDPSELAEMADLDLSKLEEEGYVKKSKGRFIISPKGIKRIERNALTEIFSSLKRDSFGAHDSQARGNSAIRQEETKQYDYGDSLSNLDLTGTLHNALRRQGPRVPIDVEEDDFVVYTAESVTRCATVLLLDMSGSMGRYGKFYRSKKVALALQHLIQTQFPQDNLYFAGFHSQAEELALHQLPYLMPKPVSMWDPHIYLKIDAETREKHGEYIPQHFTNLQAGLRLARKILRKETCQNKQIMLITDGEPTAHFEDNVLYLVYPPNRRTAAETLKEVAQCTKDRLTINTFALIDDFYYFGLQNFIGEMTQLNKGRAFYPMADELGKYVLDDYISGRKKRVI